MAVTDAEFRPQIDSYSGPLDLLLFLVKKDEVDVFDIPIARVIEQYRGFLTLLQEIDPNACGEFLVLLAQLIEIKSKLLLPREIVEGEDEEYEDPRLELVQQLLEFKKYKERALLLESRYEEFSRRYRRPAVALPEFDETATGPVFVGKVTVWDLLTVFQRIQLSLGERGPHRVVLHERSIEEYTADVELVLCEAPSGRLLFSALFANVTSRDDAIGLLLAVLEMAKTYRVAIERDDGAVVEEGDEPIYLRLRSPEETEAIMEQHRADEAENADPAETALLRGEGDEARKEPIRSTEEREIDDTVPDGVNESDDAEVPPGANRIDRSLRGPSASELAEELEGTKRQAEDRHGEAPDPGGVEPDPDGTEPEPRS